MRKKYKIIAIVGKSGSGKDTLIKRIFKEDFHKELKKIIPYTTREKRDYEVEGEDYHFIDTHNFLYDRLYDFFTVSCFNGWHYGMSLSDLDEEKINIGIFNMDALMTLNLDPHLECIPIYLKTNDKKRIIRILKREKNPNIKECFRRYEEDEKDFSEVEDHVTFTLVNDKIEDLDTNVAFIKKIVELWNGGKEND